MKRWHIINLHPIFSFTLFKKLVAHQIALYSQRLAVNQIPHPTSNVLYSLSLQAIAKAIHATGNTPAVVIEASAAKRSATVVIVLILGIHVLSIKSYLAIIIRKQVFNSITLLKIRISLSHFPPPFFLSIYKHSGERTVFNYIY